SVIIPDTSCWSNLGGCSATALKKGEPNRSVLPCPITVHTGTINKANNSLHDNVLLYVDFIVFPIFNFHICSLSLKGQFLDVIHRKHPLSIYISPLSTLIKIT